LKAIVYHTYYGCETGCCGHTVEIGEDRRFEFAHPFGDDFLEFAKDLVRTKFGDKHVADLDWEQCVIVDD
jgi:hypothetical protein